MSYRTERAVWKLTGKEPLAFLEATTSQDHSGQQVGETRWCCVLDPHGRVLAFFRSIPLEDGSVLLDGEQVCEAGVAWLASIAPLSRNSIQRESDLVVAAGTSELAGAVASSPRADGLPGVDSIVPASAANQLEPIDAATEGARIAQGWPVFGKDITRDHILNDTPLLALCVSYTKGCYRGQETVAKISNLGHARRAYVRVAGDNELIAGAQLVAAGTPIGSLTSTAHHLGRPVAIGIVKREHAVSGEAQVEDRGVRVEPLILAEEPPKAAAAPAPPRMGRSFGRR